MTHGIPKFSYSEVAAVGVAVTLGVNECVSTGRGQSGADAAGPTSAGPTTSRGRTSDVPTRFGPTFDGPTNVGPNSAVRGSDVRSSVRSFDLCTVPFVDRAESSVRHNLPYDEDPMDEDDVFGLGDEGDRVDGDVVDAVVDDDVVEIPIPKLMEDISILYHVPLNQFYPNAFREMMGFSIVEST